MKYRCISWAFFEPFLIAVRGRGGRLASDRRRVLDAVFWIARTGSPWRDLPEEFGKWASVYRQFRRWTLAGLWALVLDALNWIFSVWWRLRIPPSKVYSHGCSPPVTA